jgi:uncharacterized protein YegP (UPF0339 family)
MTNTYKTTDIKIHTDSAGCFSADHRFHGTLIDSEFYESRAACRRDAVEVLKEKKELTFAYTF